MQRRSIANGHVEANEQQRRAATRSGAGPRRETVQGEQSYRSWEAAKQREQQSTSTVAQDGGVQRQAAAARDGDAWR